MQTEEHAKITNNLAHKFFPISRNERIHTVNTRVLTRRHTESVVGVATCGQLLRYQLPVRQFQRHARPGRLPTHGKTAPWTYGRWGEMPILLTTRIPDGEAGDREGVRLKCMVVGCVLVWWQLLK